MSPDNLYLYRDGFRIHPLLRTEHELCCSSWIHAKREWTCVECRRIIQPREHYLNFSWVDHEQWHAANYCAECAYVFGLRLVVALSGLSVEREPSEEQPVPPGKPK